MSAAPPVELHVISDSTGETAARLVSALEAQFPDLEFEEVRHPRAETSRATVSVDQPRNGSALTVSNDSNSRTLLSGWHSSTKPNA